MAREWRVEEEARGIDGAMEAMLVEVFGCTSFGDNEMKGDFMKGKRISYRDRFVPVHEMEEMLVEIFGCTSLNGRDAKALKRTKVDFSRYVAAMEPALVEIFGCTSLNGRDAKALKRTKVDFSRYVAAMEPALVEIFGCTPPDHKVISFEMIKDRKRDKKDLSAELPVADVEAQRSGAMLKLA